ncbi:MAG: hypothetical protein E7214_01915 [Clostridium sp.]|nr:hypothetical protein [Clostridium sp.]
MKKILGLLLTASILCSVPVYSKAMESNEAENIQVADNNVANSISNDIKEGSNFVECKDGADASNILNSNKVKSKFNLRGAATPNATDAYEPNNNSSTAKSGLQNKVISANLGTENDVDWYTLNVDQSDVNSTIYSFILTDIPQGCDYDLVAISADGSTAAYKLETGSTSECFYAKLPKAGTWYVVVQSKGEYSESNYKLYFGNTYYSGSTRINTDINYNFGYYNVDHSKTYNVHACKYSDKYTLDLSNAAFIPDQSVTTGASITSDGRGYWIGLTKYLQMGSDTYSCQYGTGIDFIQIQANKHYTKIPQSLYASVEYSEYFTWTPSLTLDYVFPVTLANLRFLRQ